MLNSKETLLSIIVVYTDLPKLQEAKMWIDKQTIRESIEFIALDNREKRFSSAAKALNYGAETAIGDILVFMHQDIYLWDETAMESYRSYLLENPDTVIGVAGKTSDGKVITDIWETKNKIERGIRANGQAHKMETLDECLFAMTQKTWQRLRFDEVCCSHWHGYAVDICLANRLSGNSNMMIPLKICHESLGNTNSKEFQDTMVRIVKKYRGTGIDRIYGTCIQIKCSMRSYYWYRTKRTIKNVLRPFYRFVRGCFTGKANGGN